MLFGGGSLGLGAKLPSRSSG